MLLYEHTNTLLTCGIMCKAGKIANSLLGRSGSYGARVSCRHKTSGDMSFRISLSLL